MVSLFKESIILQQSLLTSLEGRTAARRWQNLHNKLCRTVLTPKLPCPDTHKAVLLLTTLLDKVVSPPTRSLLLFSTVRESRPYKKTSSSNKQTKVTHYSAKRSATYQKVGSKNSAVRLYFSLQCLGVANKCVTASGDGVCETGGFAITAAHLSYTGRDTDEGAAFIVQNASGGSSTSPSPTSPSTDPSSAPSSPPSSAPALPSASSSGFGFDFPW